jgi:hypothetical protein
LSSINQENVEAIQRSVQLVGPLHEIIKDQNGRTLSGRHRELADQGWPTRTIEVKDAFQRELIILLSNVQRQPTEEEMKFRLNRLAMEYWIKHKCPEEKVCTALIELFNPENGAKIFKSPRRIEQLLDDRWKLKTCPKKTETVSVSNIEQKADETNKHIEKLAVRASTNKPYSIMNGCICPNCPNKNQCFLEQTP